MALQGPFFGKRDSEQPLPTSRPLAGGSFTTVSHPASPSAPPDGGNSVTPPSNAQSLGIPSADPATESASSNNSAKLTVGPNIKLKGVEIADCDTLVIEGTVEATVNSRVLQIAKPGAYKGSAEIDIAEVHGAFDGNLTVRQKLVIFASGRVSGKVRYGKIVIEEGGQISGEVTMDGGANKKPASDGKAPGAA